MNSRIEKGNPLQLEKDEVIVSKIVIHEESQYNKSQWREGDF